MVELIEKLPFEALLPSDLSQGLTPAERILLDKAEKGELTDFRTKKEEEDNLENAPDWGPERIIRSEFLFWLCTDTAAVERIHPKGVRISGAFVPTKLDFSFCQLPLPLAFEFCSVPGGFDFEYAHIRCFSLVSSTSGPIFAHSLHSNGELKLDYSDIKGEVRLLGATIKGRLRCTGTSLKNPNGYALFADGISVESGVFLRTSFQAEGKISLVGARIKGQLDCNEASLKNPNGYALFADGILVEGSIFLSNGFQAEGKVSLIGARIKGQLNCSGASLKNVDGCALFADNISVEGNLFLNNGFQAEGEVRLPYATIKGQLDCIGASLKNVNDCAICFQNMVVTDVMLFVFFQLEGIVDLRNAKVGQLLDKPESWPKKGNLLMNGFTYNALADGAPKEVDKRLEWIALQPNTHFSPQPYEQLAKVYRSMGLEKHAKEVLIAKQEALRVYGGLGWFDKIWNWILGKSIGHGYKSWRLLLYVIIPLILLGWGLFWCADKRDVMQPTKDNPYKFNAFVYSVDAFLPIVKLHQEEFWLPKADKPYGSFFRLYLWIHIGLGWLFTTLFVVSLTGVVKKE